MKVGDLVHIERAYGAKGIIVAMRKEMYHNKLVCDVWLYVSVAIVVPWGVKLCVGPSHAVSHGRSRVGDPRVALGAEVHELGVRDQSHRVAAFRSSKA